MKNENQRDAKEMKKTNRSDFNYCNDGKVCFCWWNDNSIVNNGIKKRKEKDLKKRKGLRLLIGFKGNRENVLPSFWKMSHIAWMYSDISYISYHLNISTPVIWKCKSSNADVDWGSANKKVIL